MVIKDVDVEMDESVMAQLLALPYSLEVDDEGHIIMTPLQPPGLTWEEIIESPMLPDDLGWKVETDAQNRIIMSPAPSRQHQNYGLQIVLLLTRLLPHGRAFYETGVKTRNGTRIPDVGWVSDERRSQQGTGPSYSPIPEICVEVISPSNSRREIKEKTQRYLDAGASEVWTCAQNGNMSFFNAEGQIDCSVFCPDFPTHLDA